MINFLDILQRQPEQTLKIINGFIKEGEIINIFGEPFVGKTLFCYWIINNNPRKSVFYFDTEASLYPFLNKAGKEINIIYTTINDIKKIFECIKKTINLVDYFVIDSLTATIMENNKNVLLNIFSFIKKNKKNLILVSQVREWNGQIFYDYKRFLNFFCYKAKIDEKGGKTFINDSFNIDKRFLKKFD